MILGATVTEPATTTTAAADTMWREIPETPGSLTDSSETEMISDKRGNKSF